MTVEKVAKSFPWWYVTMTGLGWMLGTATVVLPGQDNFLPDLVASWLAGMSFGLWLILLLVKLPDKAPKKAPDEWERLLKERKAPRGGPF